MSKHRLTIEEYGCMLSLIGKGRSEDPHTKVSAVAISRDKRVLGISYNGLPSGQKVEKWMTLEENRVEKGECFIHDVVNLSALLKVGECDLVCANLSPCISCCSILSALKVKRVVFLKEYHRCNKFKKFFKRHKIKWRELTKKEKQNIKNYLMDITNFTELE